MAFFFKAIAKLRSVSMNRHQERVDFFSAPGSQWEDASSGRFRIGFDIAALSLFCRRTDACKNENRVADDDDRNRKRNRTRLVERALVRNPIGRRRRRRRRRRRHNRYPRRSSSDEADWFRIDPRSAARSFIVVSVSTPAAIAVARAKWREFRRKRQKGSAHTGL